MRCKGKYQFQNARDARNLDWSFVLGTLNHLTIGHTGCSKNRIFSLIHQQKKFLKMGITDSSIEDLPTPILRIQHWTIFSPKARANIESENGIEIQWFMDGEDLGFRWMGFRRDQSVTVYTFCFFYIEEWFLNKIAQKLKLYILKEKVNNIQKINKSISKILHM